MSIKTNTTSLQSLLEAVNSLPEAGGIELPTLTNEGSADDLLTGKELIDGEGNVVTGTIEIKTGSDLTTNGATVTVPAGYYASQATKSVATATQATPSVSIDSNGLITASATQSAGYVNAGTKSGTKQLTTQSAKTITPTKSSQTAVSSGVYTTGTVTVAAIPSQYITTTDATAEASEIMSGETAYVNGSKVTGTFTLDDEIATQDDLIAQIASAVDSLPDAEDFVLQNKTVTPTASSQTVTADSGYDALNSVVVNGDENLVAENIKSGVSIFGVSGTLEEGSGESSGDSSIETCTLNFTLNDPSNKFAMSYHTYENGKVLSHLYEYNDTIPTTITNFISNSILMVHKYHNKYSLV